jgi:hypothetical protein
VVTRSEHNSTSEDQSHPKTGGPRRPSAVAVIRKASEQFRMVTQHEAESVSALSQSDDGWELNIEVVEVPRIPETTSVMATYVVRLDSHGDLASYERLRRYSRGQLDQ